MAGCDAETVKGASAEEVARLTAEAEAAAKAEVAAAEEAEAEEKAEEKEDEASIDVLAVMDKVLPKLECRLDIPLREPDEWEGEATLEQLKEDPLGPLDVPG